MSSRARDTPELETARGVPAQSMVEHLAPLLQTDNESDAWQYATRLAMQRFSGDFAATIEFLGDARATFRSAEGFGDVGDGETFPVAPDSQAAHVRSSGQVCISNDVLIDPRFEAPRFLTSAGVRSTMTVSFALGSGGGGLLGVHSRSVGAFADADADKFEALARLLGNVIERIRTRCALEIRACTDALTGLDNRATILEDLGERLDQGRLVTALLIDLDGFKSVNDQHGHAAGDVVLQTVASRLERSVTSGDCVGRLGGDEFLILLDGRVAANRAEQLIGHIEQAIMIDSRAVGVSASIGVSRDRPGDDATSMLERADRMMYEAKALGRGQVGIDDAFEPKGDSAPAPSTPLAQPDLAIVDDAIAHLEVIVQPIVYASDGAVFGVEALAHSAPGQSLASTEDLLEAATMFGRLDELDIASKKLAFDLDLPGGVTLFVKLERALLSDQRWFRRLMDAWRSNPSPPPIAVEITERSVMDHPGRLLGTVEACRDLGWQIALVDVGSRSESLAALRWIEPDIVKLDTNMIHSRNPARSAHMVTALAAYRNTPSRRDVVVIAEGVDSQADIAHAQVLGADLLQGSQFGCPAPIDDLHLPSESAMATAARRPISRRDEQPISKADLLNISRHIEGSALSADCVVLATVQDVAHFTRRTRRQYRAMARRCGFVGVLGSDVSSVAASEVLGVHLADLPADDPLVSSWQVLVMSPTGSFGLLATEVDPHPGTTIDQSERRFRYRIVSEPLEVEHAVRRLLRYF